MIWLTLSNRQQYSDKFRAQLKNFIERESTLMLKRQEKAKTTNSIEELRELNGWVEHTYKVIGSAQAIVAAAVDMETGMRGFLLAGEFGCVATKCWWDIGRINTIFDFERPHPITS